MLGRPSLQALWIATAAATAVHAAEEVVFKLGAWSQAHPVVPWLSWMDRGFNLAAAIVVAAVTALAGYAAWRRPAWSGAALRVLAWVMLANAISHVGLSISTQSCMQGVGTALGVLAPVFGFVAFRRN